jgi:hypothetical protein
LADHESLFFPQWITKKEHSDTDEAEELYDEGGLRANFFPNEQSPQGEFIFQKNPMLSASYL